MKLRIQVGVENKASGIRLTPLDRAVVVEDLVANVLLLVAGMVDSKDIQPGDGEMDFSLGHVAGSQLEKLVFLKTALKAISYIPGEETVFVKVRPV